jgi:hypothetical protein
MAATDGYEYRPGIGLAAVIAAAAAAAAVDEDGEDDNDYEKDHTG